MKRSVKDRCRDHIPELVLFWALLTFFGGGL